ncbi:MAG: AbgT family transporter [Clostridiales bacterium]|nr:AbgT family transporter [Clostridiales bacterium]
MEKTANARKGGKVLDFIERVGNKLPHPYILFLWLCLILAVISLLCSVGGVSVVNPTSGDTVVANSLLSKDGLIWLLKNLLSNFQNFAPLGLVLAMQMAIGFAERVGLLTTAMRKAILGVPLWALTATVLFLGINGSIASEASIIVVPSLAAAAFESVGMHPIAGLLAGYAATNAGFTACIIIAGTDVLLSGVTETAAQLIDPAMQVNATCNWYFMIASVFLLTIVGVFVNRQFIVPRLGEYHPQNGEASAEQDVTGAQSKALRNAGIFTVLYILLFAVMVIPANGILRGEDGSILNGPFIAGLVPVLILFFILVGVVYGITAGTIKNSSDVPNLMAQALDGMTSYIVLVFVIAQFINMFSYTNLGMIIAVKSADALKAAGFTGIPLMLFFILLCCVVNLFMTSGSGKWYIFAPILVPMMMMMGYSPAFAQIIYRIGDSTTNAITPIYPYIPIAIGMAKTYDKDFGMGSLISMMLPYSVAFLLVWIVQLIVWMGFNLPLGPGAGVFL